MMTFREAADYVMPFGAHKGKSVDQCPLKYLDWFHGWLEDVDHSNEDLRNAVKVYLGDTTIQKAMKDELEDL